MNNINNSVRILVIGDLMIDHYIYGNCTRISPEAPVQVVEVKRDVYTLGGAGNVLQNLLSFGCEAKIISVTGDDENFQLIDDELKKSSIRPQTLIKDKNRCTTVKSRVMVSNHQLIRLDREEIAPIDEDIASTIIDVLKKDIASYSIVLLSDYNKGLFSHELLKNIFGICRAAGVKTMLDPKGADFLKYRGVNIIKPNKAEAIIASGIVIKDEDSLKDACLKIKEITFCDDVIITMSEDGIALFTNNTLEIIPTKALDVVDVTGAGDTVLASLGISLASGNSLYEACNFANHAAAVVINKVGSATTTLTEIRQRFEN